MKKLLFLYGFILIIFITCSGNNEWVAKVDGKIISKKDFDNRYRMYINTLSQQPGWRQLSFQEENMLKQEILKTMIGEQLVYKELKKEKFDKKPEVQQLFRQFLIQKYLEERLISKISVSTEEVEKFFKENKQYFKNMDPEMAQQRINYQLMLKKYETATSELIDKLYAKAKVEQNENIFLTSNAPNFSTNKR